jgi:hypothetical protein
MPDEHSPRLLSPPEYSAEEQQALIDFVLALRKTHVQDFLKKAELPRSGTKEDLRERLQEALDGGDLTYERLVAFLDSLAPWGKQHVFLYRGPLGDVQAWKDPDHVQGLLKGHRLGRLFNATLPLILPEKLTLSSVTHANGMLRVTAVQKREYTERAEEHDEEKESENGEKITLKAYVHHLTRTLTAFEWDLNANVAVLQMTQLQEDGDYERLAEQFTRLISPWLDIKQFTHLDLRPVIHRLHEIEKNGQAEARSHGIDYRSLQGRRVSARSPSPRASVLGEQFIDDAMESVRKNGVGHLGNFYWLSGVKPGPAVNPLTGEVHVIIVGAKSRVNFPTPNTEDVLRYVLHRMRALG